MGAQGGAIEFGSAYYRHVIEVNGYDPTLFDGFTEDLPHIPREDLERTFLCHKGLYEFRDSPVPKAALTGFGLSGVPHLGTLSQMNRIGLLNQAGYRTEVVLGDLDAYNGKLTSIERVHELARVYQTFVEGTGLLNPDNSVVRNQYDHPEVLRTAYLLGRFATDEAFEGAEEDLHGLYAAKGKVDSAMTYRRKLSLNLMLADFFHLGQTHPEVLVMLGVDEHQYVKVGQELAGEVDASASGLTPVRISSLYTPIIKGFNGYPKMSKSFPGSGITLDMSKHAIDGLIMDENDDFGTPEESVVFQMACGLGLGGDATLSEAFAAAKERGGAWYDIKKLLVGRVAMFSDQWHEASEQCGYEGHAQ